MELLGSLSCHVFEQRTSTGSVDVFALLSRAFEQIFGLIVSIRVKTLSNTNLVASKGKNAHFRLTCFSLKLPCLHSLVSVSL